MPHMLHTHAAKLNLVSGSQISKKLACGDIGNGALAEPQVIANAVKAAVLPVNC